MLFFVISILLFAGGCASTEYNYITGRMDRIVYSPEREVEMGLRAAERLEEAFPKDKDVLLQERIQKLGRRIVNVCDRPDIPYSFYVIDMPVENAVSLPGGKVYISKKLIELLKSDDLISAVLAHEIGHIVLKHHIKKLQASYAANILAVGAVLSADKKTLAAAGISLNSLFSAYSQEDEFAADKLAVKYLQRAGFSGLEMAASLELLAEKERYTRQRKVSYFRTHPYIQARIARARSLAKGDSLSAFIDYINKPD